MTWNNGGLHLELVNQLLERHVLVRIGPQRRLAHALEQLREARIARQVPTQHERVDEASDEVFHLALRTASDGRPDTEVLLTAVPHEQHLEGSQQGHVQRRSRCLTARLQGWQVLAEVDREGVAEVALDRRTGAVGGQIQQRRGSCQAVSPIGEIPLQTLALQPAALPMGEVHVLGA